MMLKQELLDPAAGTKGEFHPRVPSPTFSDANLYVGWHWRGDPLARWYTVMARSSRPKKNWIQKRNFRTGICSSRNICW